MENQKNLFLAIAISMAIIFGFQLIMPQPDPIERSTSDTSTETGIDLSQTTPQTIVTFEDKEKVLSSSERVTFNNGKISGSINLSGAIIDDLVLLEYRKLLDINSKKINSCKTPVIFDGRNQYNAFNLEEKGFEYFQIGR